MVKISGDPESHSAQGVCGVKNIQEGQHKRDLGGFQALMALLEQEGLGLCWWLLLTCWDVLCGPWDDKKSQDGNS